MTSLILIAIAAVIVIFFLILIVALRSGVKTGMRIEVNGIGPFHPGDTISVRVSLSPEKSFHIDQGLLVLACMESYDEGTGFNFQTIKMTRGVLHLSEVFLEDTDMFYLFPYQMDVSFSIPADAPPSSDDITWELTATLFGANAKDGQQVQEVIIHANSPSGRTLR